MRVTGLFSGAINPRTCDGCGTLVHGGVETSDGKHWHEDHVADTYAPMVPLRVTVADPDA